MANQHNINHKSSSNIHLVKHPLVDHKLTLLRDKNTKHYLFRELVSELTMLLTVEATRTLPTKKITISTPMEEMEADVLTDQSPVIIPILRAGIGMVDAFLKIFPHAKVGHIGMARNEKTYQPESYYFKIPFDTQNRPVFICDPMLATGGSVAAAITQLKAEGIKRITIIAIIGAPEGIEHIQQEHPDVPIYIGAIDPKLNQDAYIVPGLGDAGDRLFGTTV